MIQQSVVKVEATGAWGTIKLVCFLHKRRLPEGARDCHVTLDLSGSVKVDECCAVLQKAFGSC